MFIVNQNTQYINWAWHKGVTIEQLCNLAECYIFLFRHFIISYWCRQLLLQRLLQKAFVGEEHRSRILGEYFWQSLERSSHWSTANRSIIRLKKWSEDVDKRQPWVGWLIITTVKGIYNRLTIKRSITTVNRQGLPDGITSEAAKSQSAAGSWRNTSRPGPDAVGKTILLHRHLMRYAPPYLVLFSYLMQIWRMKLMLSLPVHYRVSCTHLVTCVKCISVIWTATGDSLDSTAFQNFFFFVNIFPRVSQKSISNDICSFLPELTKHKMHPTTC